MSEVLVSAYIGDGKGGVEGEIQLAYSDNGNNWGSNAIVPLSSAPVGLAAFNSLLWTAYRGHTSNTLYVSSSSNWQNVETGQSTNLSPSITVFQNKLWVAYIGEATGRIEVISSGNGTNWSDSTATGQSSKLSPSIIVFQNKLWIAFIGQQTGRIEVISSSDGKTWLKSTATGYDSNLPPSLAVFQNQLWIAFTGQGNNVEVISSGTGVNWPAKSTATGKSSKFPPSITAFKNELWIAFVGEGSGHVELLSSGGGADWAGSIDTGQSTQDGPSLAAVAAVGAVSGFGGNNQYVFASPQGNGWPSNTKVDLPPITNLLLYITITEPLHFNSNTPLSFQLNCSAPATGKWKIGFQQYCLIMQPGSTELILHIQNFERNSSGLAVYAGSSVIPNFNFPSLGVIPAGWIFQLALQYTGNLVSGVSCLVFDESGKTLGETSLGSINLPLASPPLPKGSGLVDETWLAPIVAFQLVVVGYSEGAHTTFTSGSGFVINQSNTPLVAANTWAGSANGAEGLNTTESSNSVYSVVPNLANLGIIQCFGAPPSV